MTRLDSLMPLLVVVAVTIFVVWMFGVMNEMEHCEILMKQGIFFKNCSCYWANATCLGL